MIKKIGALPAKKVRAAPSPPTEWKSSDGAKFPSWTEAEPFAPTIADAQGWFQKHKWPSFDPERLDAFRYQIGSLRHPGYKQNKKIERDRAQDNLKDTRLTRSAAKMLAANLKKLIEIIDYPGNQPADKGALVLVQAAIDSLDQLEMLAFDQIISRIAVPQSWEIVAWNLLERVCEARYKAGHHEHIGISADSPAVQIVAQAMKFLGFRKEATTIAASFAKNPANPLVWRQNSRPTRRDLTGKVTRPKKAIIVKDQVIEPKKKRGRPLKNKS